MWDNLIFGTTKRKINKTILNDGEISLEVNWISQQEYGFNIILLSTKEQVGQCDLRTKHNESMFYYGNIGYRVYPKYRGHSYALKACKLLLNLARTLKVEYLILTVSPENVASVWVKNEWSRFLKMRSDSKRTIIPAYKGMSPYELPAELASLQSLDMSRIGFLQDLTDGIDKLLIKPRNTEEVQAQGANESNKTILSADRLIQNGSTFLSLRKYQEAETAFGHATEMYPEDYRGWWGLIQCRTICFTKTTGFSERDLSLLRDYFAFIKQLAPENEYYSLHKQIMEYCFLVAQSKVPEERNMAKKEIQEKQQQLTDIEDRIKNITESINNYYPEQQKELHEKIIFNKYELEWFEAALKRAERLSVAGKVLIITGVVLFIFLVRISSINGFLPFVGVGVGFIGFLLAGKGKKVSAYKNLEQCKADIANFEAQEKEIISRCEEEKKRLRNIESSSQAEIPKINETVGRLEKVLALGADELAQTLLPRVLLYFGIDNEEVI